MCLFSFPLNFPHKKCFLQSVYFSALSCHLNSTRGYKNLYFCHLALNKLVHIKYMMITHVYVPYSFEFIFLCFCYHCSVILVLCIFISLVIIISKQKYKRWHDTSYICALVEKSTLGFEGLYFLYFDFLEHIINIKIEENLKTHYIMLMFGFLMPLINLYTINI